MGQGTVSGRVALLLRSAEVKPMFDRFVQLTVELFFIFYLFIYHAATLGQVHLNFDTGRGMCSVILPIVN
jgi:hypothetical protein